MNPVKGAIKEFLTPHSPMKKYSLSTLLVFSVLILSIVYSSLAYAGTPVCRNLIAPLKTATFPVIAFVSLIDKATPGLVSTLTNDEKCDIYNNVLKPYIQSHKKKGDKIASLIVIQGQQDAVLIKSTYLRKAGKKEFYPLTEAFPSLRQNGRFVEWQEENDDDANASTDEQERLACLDGCSNVFSNCLGDTNGLSTDAFNAVVSGCSAEQSSCRDACND